MDLFNEDRSQLVSQSFVIDESLQDLVAEQRGHSAQVIQPLVVPGISFFNAIPSLHLHVFARVNPPRLAVWFSTSLALCFFISAIFFLGSCVGNDSTTGQISRNECPAGAQGNQQVWDAMVTLQMLSGVLYSLHAAMGLTVDKALRNQERRIEQGIEMVSEEEKERRHSMARERWKHLSAG